MLSEQSARTPFWGKLLLCVGLLVLAGLVVKLTHSGTLVVTVNEPNAEVLLQQERSKVEIVRTADQGAITVSLIPGTYRLKTTKAGFEPQTHEIRVDAGGKTSVNVNLVPKSHVGAEPWNSPAFRQWMDHVGELSGEEQVAAVAKKLRELNPRFTGEMSHQIENGVVRGLFFETDNVTDISPVRALPELKALSCPGDWRDKGKLSDLSPLTGLSLTSLWCGSNPVADLSPLKGMPLTFLSCEVSKVTDLSPLHGMRLTTLFLYDTKVSDLSPLRAMPLTDLRLTYAPISDLTPLVDCKSLQLFNVRRTKVTAAGVAALKEALPKCGIHWDDPSEPDHRFEKRTIVEF